MKKKRRHRVLFGARRARWGCGVVEAVVIPGASGGEPHSAYLPIFGGLGADMGFARRRNRCGRAPVAVR